MKLLYFLFRKEYLAFSYSKMSPKLFVLFVCGAVTNAVGGRDHAALNDKLSSLINKEVKAATAVTVLSLFE